MPIHCFERAEMRNFNVSADKPSGETMWCVTGTDDELIASAAFEAEVPAILYGLIIQNYLMKERGGGIWDIPVTYGTRERLQPSEAGQSNQGGAGNTPGDVKSAMFTFDTTGGTAHITHSLETISQTPNAAVIASYEEQGRAINVNAEGIAEGIDITVPQFSFTVQRLLRDPLPGSYVTALYGRTGCVNSDTVNVLVSGIDFHCSPGELLFMGATGSKRGREEWDIQLKFAYNPNLTGLTFGTGGNVIGGIDKKGWEYLWVKCERVAANSPATGVVLRPKQVNVERVYRTAALGPLLS